MKTKDASIENVLISRCICGDKIICEISVKEGPIELIGLMKRFKEFSNGTDLHKVILQLFPGKFEVIIETKNPS